MGHGQKEAGSRQGGWVWSTITSLERGKFSPLDRSTCVWVGWLPRQQMLSIDFIKAQPTNAYAPVSIPWLPWRPYPIPSIPLPLMLILEHYFHYAIDSQEIDIAHAHTTHIHSLSLSLSLSPPLLHTDTYTVQWEPEKLTCEIDFVLGVNVNK